MKYLKSKIIIIVLLSIFIISFNIPTVLKDNNDFLVRDLGSSGSWNLSPLIIDDVGLGDYTWSQAVLQPWCHGAGTFNDPYVIENVTIDGGFAADCIMIRNSSKYFIIRNSTFINSGWSGDPPYMGGITLDAVDNAMLINNTCRDCLGWGISIYRSNGVVIKDSFIENNSRGISSSTGDSHKIINNSLTLNNVIGISIRYGENNEIEGNTFRDGRIGIILTYSSNNIIKANNIQFYSLCGILPSYRSEYNNISGNLIFQAKDGIIIKPNNYHNIISSNNISYSTDNGIVLDGENEAVDNNIIIGNNISNSFGNAIRLVKNCDSNRIEGNKITQNIQSGIRIEDSDCMQNMIQNNYFITNGIHALDLGSSTYWNSSEIGNYWDNYTGPDFNDDGIGDVPHNITLSPLINDFLPIWDDGDDITPPELTITTPSEYQVVGHNSPEFVLASKSLYIDSIWYNVNNSVVNYTSTGFIVDINQAEWDNLNDGDITMVFYANDSLGNTGSVDLMVEKDVTLPILVINSPEDNEVFSSEAPSFNITVIEKNFLSCWYSLDGGVTNFSISSYNGTINQTAWNNAPSGNIVITFYAEDMAGNLAYNETIVTKGFPSTAIPGYNLALLITLIGITSVVLSLSTIKRRKIKNSR